MEGVLVNTPVRVQGPARTSGRIFGPLKDEDNGSMGVCLGCGNGFEAGQRVAIIVLGPGDDESTREKCLKGRWYSSQGVPVHIECAGLPPDAKEE